MNSFFRFALLLTLNLWSLQPAFGAPSINAPVESSLKGDALPNVIYFAGGRTSCPLGQEVEVVLPTSLIKANARLSAGIRWRKTPDSELRDEAVAAARIGTADAAAKIKEAQTDVANRLTSLSKNAQDQAKNIDVLREWMQKASDASSNWNSTLQRMGNSTQVQQAIDKMTDLINASGQAENIISRVLAGQPTGKDSAIEVTSALGKAKTDFDSVQSAATNSGFVSKAGKMKGNLDAWTGNLPLRVIESKNDLTTIGIRLPEQMKGPSPDCLGRPTAELRLVTTGNGDPGVDVVLPLKISSTFWASVIALIFTLVFWLICYVIARLRKIPGEGFKGGVLKIVVNKHGYASLSQFQIMLWTLVVGTSAIYVVVLTGTLIDINATILGLLGIAGAATLLSKTKSSAQDKETAPASKEPKPGGVVDLQVCGQPAGTQAVLAWKPPVAGGVPDHYEIQYRLSGQGAAWTTAQDLATESPLTVVGLVANNTYDFQVFAVNTAGEKTGRILQLIHTPAAGPANVPQVQNVEAIAPKQDTITVTWAGLAPSPDCYVVRCREDGTGTWVCARVVAGSVTQCDVSGLWPDTNYEFDVSAVTSGQKGIASNIVSNRTAWRQPQYSDLLLSEDGKEIDVSRIQMLFFTVITAGFVLFKIYNSQAIPEIPESFLLLMGISNGVYLGAKFVGR